jgi:hypothetical protein
MKFKSLFIVTVLCLSLMGLAELSLASGDRPEDIEIAGADTVENQYRIVFESQRPASDFGIKGFGKVLYSEGKPKIILDTSFKIMTILDDFGNIQEQRTLEKAQFLLSHNANFIGIRRMIDEWTWDYTFENSQGEVLWQITGSGHIEISDKGEGVVFVGYRPNFQIGDLYFYNNLGLLVKHIDTDRLLTVRISPIGDKLYVSAPDSLIAYNMQANKLWGHATEGGKILISNNGELVFNVQVMSERELYCVEIYNNQGLLIGELKFQNRFRLLGISGDGRFIAVAEGKKLHMFEVRTQALKWTYDLQGDIIPKFDGMGLWTADVGEDAQLTAVIVSGGQKIGPGPSDWRGGYKYIRILDLKGRKIFERFLQNIGPPIQVELSIKNGIVTVLTGKNIYTFKIERQ